MPAHPIDFRYYSDEMRNIWEEEARLQTWLTVESALAKVHAKVGNIPQEVADEIAKKASTKYVKTERVKEIDKEIHHDLMAMVKALAEQCEGDAGKYVHLGATSYDIEDSANALQFRDAIAIIEKELKKMLNTLLDLTEKHKNTVCIGRTHSVHALPTTYGLKFAQYVTETQRNLERLKEVKERILVGKMSGAVGTQASFGKQGLKIQKMVMEELGIKPALVSTQVLSRDRHAELVSVLGIIASSLEKIAKEIRNLQRTEIAEVFEPFTGKQVGSSTMPHKRNPHKCERICALARVVRSNIEPELETVALEHERDLTNSSLERVTFPTSFILLDYMLKQMNLVLSGLEFNYDNIKKNLTLTRGMNMAEHVMMGLVKKGVGRQEGHELLREAAIKAAKENRTYKEVLLENEIIKKNFTEEELDWYLDPNNYIGTAVEQVENVIKTLRGNT